MATPGSLWLRRAARVVRAGGLIAYPTEGVWGLGCDPLSEVALARILAVKGRPASKGMILVADDLALLEPFLAPLLPDLRERVRDGSRQGAPVTWLLTARRDLPRALTGGRDTLAVRVTRHPVAAALSRHLGAPLVSTSANRSGRPPARSAWAVRAGLGRGVDLLVPGALGGASGPSRIVDAVSGRVLR
jgi:L-threonylcarbamoyladenylate synthase